MRLLVRRRDASGRRDHQTLTVRVLDEDAGKSDDLLGVARLPLTDLIDGSLVKIPLTGEIGLAREEEVTAELTSEGGGIGGGRMSLQPWKANRAGGPHITILSSLLRLSITLSVRSQPGLPKRAESA